MISLRIDDNSPLKDDALLVKEVLLRNNSLSQTEDTIELYVGSQAVLSFKENDICSNEFTIDLFNEKLLWRLNHSGKSSEPVCKAVIGKLCHPVVFDATAGLGRESMILQSAGATVTMFERNPVIWLLLRSALANAKDNSSILSSLKNGLPSLAKLGSIKDHYQKGMLDLRPEVVYYDPMFPERKKSALVKKEMRVFHVLAGTDPDTLEYAEYLCTVATHHLVVKRPKDSPPLELSFRRSSFIDGKACRFDCYFCS
ncbi:MAG: class I SAM-dependent methyltransferase [Succinivibrio sp.]